MTDWSEYGEDPDWEDLEKEAEKDLDPASLLLPAWRALGTEEIFLEGLPEVPMLVPGLDLGPGRPCGLVGGPGSGKTATVISIALSVLSGKPVFGELPVSSPGRVLHVTYDMGRRAVALRYRQFANGLGLSPGDVMGRLVVAAHPKLFLNSEGAREAFGKAARGFSLVILDNARDASPGDDENDSTFGARLTDFGAACEAAGAVGLYLHHTKKDVEEMTIGSSRGSSAIVAASGSIWGLEGEGDGPRTMRHLRPHDMSDGLLEPLTLTIEDQNRGAFDTGRFTRARVFRTGPGGAAPEIKGSSSKDSARLEVEAALSADPKITFRAMRARLDSLGIAIRNEPLLELLQEARGERGIV